VEPLVNTSIGTHLVWILVLNHSQLLLTNLEISAAFLAQIPPNIFIGTNHASALVLNRFYLKLKGVLSKESFVGLLVHLAKFYYQMGLDLVSVPVLQAIIKIPILVNLAKILYAQSVVPQYANNAKIHTSSTLIIFVMVIFIL